MRGPALICRSHYSLLRAPSSIERLAAAVRAAGYGGIAVADVNAMYGTIELFRTAASASLYARRPHPCGLTVLQGFSYCLPDKKNRLR